MICNKGKLPRRAWLKGMADYRAGHFADAIDRLNKTVALERERRYHSSWFIKSRPGLRG